MNIIDSHLHLDDKSFNLISEATTYLNRNLTDANINKAMVIYMLNQKWNLFEFLEEIDKHANLFPIINVNPLENNNEKTIDKILSKSKIYGLKIHPRIHKFRLDDYQVEKLLNLASEINLPVLIDAFPDGDFLINDLNPKMYGVLAKKCQNTKIIWAHMGGHLVLDFLMMSKRLENVFFDLSYSLLYFRNSNILQSIIYSIQNLNFNKIMFGTDYPDRDLIKSVKMSLNILDNINMSLEQKEKLFSKNAQEIYKI